MIYVLDTGALVVLFRNFYRSRFPTLWTYFDELVEANRIISVREVLVEIDRYPQDDKLKKWAKQNRSLFSQSTEEELLIVKRIFSHKHFRTLVSRKHILAGRPVADPFVIARAKRLKGTVVTQEYYKPNAAKIPNVREKFGVPCTDLEGFMRLENWVF